MDKDYDGDGEEEDEKRKEIEWKVKKVNDEWNRLKKMRK